MKFKYFETNNYSHIIILLCVTTVGVYSRFHNLGTLSIWNNEDYLAISVRSILENGIPSFPTGIIYPRALPFSYLTAAFVQIFGYSEFSLRAPGAIFSTISIILTYIFARQTIGKTTALLAATLMSVFFLEIYSANMARMYAMFTFSILLSLVSIHAAEIDGKAYYRGLAVLSILLTAFLHQLAIALILMLLVYIPYFKYKKTNPAKLIPYILILLASIIANKLIVSHYYGQWDDLVRQTINITSSENTNSFFSTVIATATPIKIQLFEHLSNIEEILFYASGLFLFGVLNYLVKNHILKLALAAVILCLLFQQLLIGFGVISAVFISQIWLKDNFDNKEFLAVIFTQLTGLFLWLAYSFIASDDAALAALKTAIKSLFPYPLIFFRIYLENFIWLSIACVLSCTYILVNIYHFKKFNGPVFLLLIFLVPLTALGFHPTAIERMFERYIYFLNPFYIIIISYGLTKLLGYLSQQWKKKNILLFSTVTLALIIGIISSREQLILRSFSFSNKHYGENTDIYNNWLQRYYFHPDHKGASLFVADNYKNGDIIISMDVLAHYSYFQKVDYQLTLSTKKDAEGWIGAKTINTSQNLKGILNKFHDQRVWIIISALRMRDFQDKKEFKQIIKLIKNYSGKPRFIARDSLTKVYCPGCD